MAEVNYNNAPTIAPQTTVPDDYQRINADPDAFGAGIAQGVKAVGAGLQHTVDFYQQVQTDQMLNDLMDKARQVVKQYQTLNGADALNAQASTQAALDKIWKEGKAGLGSPRQQEQYDQQSRMFFERFLAPQIDNHSNQQARVYANGVNEGIVDNGRGIITESPADDNSYTYGIGQMLQGRVKQAQMKYGENLPPEVMDQIRTSVGIEATEARILALTPNDPVRAKAILDTPGNQKLLSSSPSFNTLSTHVEAAANKQLAGPIADKYLGNLGVGTNSQGPTLVPRASGPQEISAIVDVLHNQESGGVASAPASAAGAIGPMQIRPATFQQYSRPGENLDINNLQDQRTIASRIVEDGLRVSGGDPQAAAVAYFSGVGNVAPPGSPTPWKKDIVDPTSGLSTSQYVAQVSAKAAKAGMLIDKAHVLDNVDKDYADNPGLAQAIRAHINERYAIANQVQQSAALAQENWRNATAAGFASEIVKSTAPGQTLSPDFYDRVARAGDQGLSASTVEGLYRFARQTSSDSLSQTAKEYGSGFMDVINRINLPADDPRRISNDSQLVTYIGANPDQLKPNGLTEASKFLKMAHEQPGQSMMVEQFLKSARLSIVGPVANVDPKAERNYSNWMNQALPQLYAGIDQGKSIAELTKDGSPLMDSIAKAKPSLADKINDKTQVPPASPQKPAFNFDVGKADITTPEAVEKTRSQIIATYKSSAQTAQDWDRANAALGSLPKGPQVPVSQ